MSMVRRCDDPACKNGPAGTPAVSLVANPEGWLSVRSEALMGETVQGDFDTAECAARGLYGAVSAKPEPAVKAPAKKRARTKK